jgi:hypothetical protein
MTPTASSGNLKDNTLNSIYDCTENHIHASVINRLLTYSFFLPTDILKNPRYAISTILILPKQEYRELLVCTDNIQQDGDVVLLYNSRYIGLSIRYDTLTDSMYAVCKTWYGAPRKQSTKQDVFDIITLLRNQ